MSAHWRLSAVAALVLLSASCGRADHLQLPDEPSAETLTLAGEFTIPSLGRFPPAVGPPFGGISGLAPLANGEWIAACDDGDGSRVYRLAFSGEGAQFRVTPIDVIGLEVGGPAPAKLDAEAVTVTPHGTLIIASEGDAAEEPRIPPALIEYDTDGRFVRLLPLRDRFVPTPTGPLTRGARDNASLESVTMAPGGERLFTGMESAIVQDGEPADVGRATVSRILEYVQDKDTYVPAREFAYQVEPIDPAPFSASVSVTGLVELLALGDDDLLALERSYLAEKPKAGTRSLNRIRVYRLSLAGATDVSALDSLAGATFTPVHKTLLLDLSTVKGLSPELATLENFEALAVGPRLADGQRSLLLASDDNFHQTQHTSFLLFRIAGRK